MVLSRDQKELSFPKKLSVVFFSHPNFEYKMVCLLLELDSDLT